MEVVHKYNIFGLVVVIVANHRRKEMYKLFFELTVENDEEEEAINA